MIKSNYCRERINKMGKVLDLDTGRVINMESDYFVEGTKHMLKDNYKQVVYYYKQGDEAGCDNCQLALGVMYFKGHTVEQDYEKAVELWVKSSKQGNSEAIYRLAQAYDNGWGVKRDYEKGQQLFKKAYEQGYEFAKFWIDENFNDYYSKK